MLKMSNWLPQIRAERPTSYRDLIPLVLSLLQMHGPMGPHDRDADGQTSTIEAL